MPGRPTIAPTRTGWTIARPIPPPTPKKGGANGSNCADGDDLNNCVSGDANCGANYFRGIGGNLYELDRVGMRCAILEGKDLSCHQSIPDTSRRQLLQVLDLNSGDYIVDESGFGGVVEPDLHLLTNHHPRPLRKNHFPVFGV